MNSHFTAVLLGMIEGVTEFLPISSTGHLLIFQHWLSRQQDLFNAVIQSGAVLAVAFVFRERITELVRGWKIPQNRAFLGKLGGAFLLTVIGGLLLETFSFTLPETIPPVAAATLLGGIAILVIEKNRREKSSDDLSWKTAIAVGAAQVAAAVFPGLSRSASTILTAVVLGTERKTATEFSFLLGVPTLLAAGALKLFSAWREGQAVDWSPLLTGTIAAFFTAVIVVRWFLRFLSRNSFSVFGWYRVALGLLLFFLLLWR